MQSKLRIEALLFALVIFQSCVGIDKTHKTNVNLETPPKTSASYFGFNELPRRPTQTRTVDLHHMMLDLEVDWLEKKVFGKAELTLTPYFYSTDSIIIDAKNLKIDSITISQGDLDVPFTTKYDGYLLKIELESLFNPKDTLLVDISYSATTDCPYIQDSIPNNDEKGLYWINHDKSLTYKPRQLWTQGETSYNSRWFPTIDHPNERCTQEVYLTVDSGYTTLSNGLLIYSMSTEKGKRRDYWRQNKAHPPYLCMIAVGDFRIVRESYPDFEVSYYVEPKFEPYARNIFGSTPEMIKYFSKLLDYPYPWEKYAQIVVRDFVSGAMENTTASVFMEDLLMDDRELIDMNWDFIIAHELFHQWFGNLVTCESWTHLTLNEALANYSEYLWTEYKNGKEYGVMNALEQLNLYLSESRSKSVPIIRYNYRSESGLFDNHTYAKGGLVMRLLRQELGDDAFFKSLNHYLKANSFSSVEIHDLRKSFEFVSGIDLEDFFQQWFLSPGHPVLKVFYSVTDTTGLQIKILQEQAERDIRIFDLNIPVFIRQNGRVYLHILETDQRTQTFSLSQYTNPDWIFVDPDKYIIGEVIQEFSIDQSISIYNKFKESAGARFESITRLNEANPSNKIFETLVSALLSDPIPQIRRLAIEGLSNKYNDKSYITLKNIIANVALSDESSLVRADALSALATIDSEMAVITARQVIGDSSYSVLAEALDVLLHRVNEAPLLAEKFAQVSNGRIVSVIADYYAQSGVEGKLDWYMNKALYISDAYAQFALLNQMGRYTLSQNDSLISEKCIDFLAKWALQPHQSFTKLAVFQSLQLFRGMPKAESAINELNNSFNDPAFKAILRLYE